MVKENAVVVRGVEVVRENVVVVRGVEVVVRSAMEAVVRPSVTAVLRGGTEMSGAPNGPGRVSSGKGTGSSSTITGITITGRAPDPGKRDTSSGASLARVS